MQKYFFIKANSSYLKIHFNEIIFIEGARNYLKIVSEKKNYLVLMSMKQMQQLLPAEMFVRIHKSYIVSLDHVTGFSSSRVFLNEKWLPIGNQFKGAMEKNVLIAQDDHASRLISISQDYFKQKTYS